ncbi:hypothetical protein PRNP1_012090 [Phytophthora ramorum]
MPSEDKRSLLQPEAPAATGEVPQVYRSLNFRSLQDPYSNRGGETMASHYSTLRTDNLDTMLNGGLERFYKKYNHLSRKINLTLPTPEHLPSYSRRNQQGVQRAPVRERGGLSEG